MLPLRLNMVPNEKLRTTITGIGALLLCAACATPPERVDPPAPVAVAPARVAAPPAQPAPPPVRVPPTPQEKQRAEQLAAESVKVLEIGDVVAGRGLVEQALALDPNNELARLMMKQIIADPVAELGSTNFSYTIQPGDTLALLARKHLKDNHLFLILARYNNIAQPNNIQVGREIKIPGKAPTRTGEPTAAGTARPPSPTPPASTAPAPSAPAPMPPVESALAKRMAEGREQERKGELERALATYTDIVRRDPQQADANQRAIEVRRRLVERYNAEGAASFARQDLDKSIAAWDRVLQLDPDNPAKLKRQQALELKERLKRFDSKK